MRSSVCTKSKNQQNCSLTQTDRNRYAYICRFMWSRSEPVEVLCDAPRQRKRENQNRSNALDAVRSREVLDWDVAMWRAAQSFGVAKHSDCPHGVVPCQHSWCRSHLSRNCRVFWCSSTDGISVSASRQVVGTSRS